MPGTDSDNARAPLQSEELRSTGKLPLQEDILLSQDGHSFKHEHHQSSETSPKEDSAQSKERTNGFLPYDKIIKEKYHYSGEVNGNLCELSVGYDPVSEVRLSNDFKRTNRELKLLHSARTVISNGNSIIYQDDDRLLPESDAISSISEPISPLPETKVYLHRFWIILVYSLFCFFACLQWNAWGPISESMIAAFPDWTYGTVAWMESLVTGMFVVCMLPVCWATGKFGLRIGMLLSTSVIAGGLALRCITDKSPVFTIMCHISATFLGIGTTLLLAAPSLVASEWFPPKERTSATAFIMAASQLGSVGSYLEPLIVQMPGENIPSSLIRKDVMHLMYIVAGIAVTFFLIVLIHFPSKPKLPPSVTSSINRLEFKIGLMTLLKDWNFMNLVILYGIASGPALGWVGMLNYSLEPLGYNQNELTSLHILKN